jgi:integrase
MARTVRDRSLETRAARRRLQPQKKPYWRSVDRGLHLGYYRGARGGGWIARRYIGEGHYQETRVGTADDVQDADGSAVLSYSQAQAKARVWFQIGLGEPAAGPFTVAHALDEYLAWIAQHRKTSTAREWRYTAHAHILPTLGAVDVASLTTTKLRRWHEELAAQPARLRSRLGSAQRYRNPSDDSETVRARRASANRVLTVLKAALNRAFNEGKAGSDEAWRRVKPFRGADAARGRYLQEDECRRLLNACPEDFGRIVRGAMLTGCRYGELCRAVACDFDGDAGTLLVREAKAGRPRHVPLDDEAIAFLEALTLGRAETERIFRRADGKPWGKSHQLRPLLVACRAAKIQPPANFHCLRHTWASHRVMKGAPLLVVAQVLGHADTRMVDKHYGHLAPSYVRDTVRATAMNLGPHGVGIVALRPR